MFKMVRAAWSNINLRCGSLAARPKLAFLLSLLVTAIAVLAALSWFHTDQVDEARSAQVILDQITVLTRKINNLTLTALQEQNLTPEADTEMREARHALPKAVLAAHLHAYHTAAPEKVWPVLDNYITSAGLQWISMQVGDFDEAKQADFQAVGPQFDLLQHQVQIAIEAEDKWAQGVALRARKRIAGGRHIGNDRHPDTFSPAQETRARRPVAGNRTQRPPRERRAIPRSYRAVN